MPTLDFEMTYRFRTRGPLNSTAGAPTGEREYWEMTEGTLEGPRVRAKIAMPGGDWNLVGSDGYGRPDVRVQLVTDDEAVVLLHYRGLVQVTDAFRQAAESGAETRFEDQYMRMGFFFEVGAPKYSWLNQSLYVAEGRIAGQNEIDTACIASADGLRTRCARTSPGSERIRIALIAVPYDSGCRAGPPSPCQYQAWRRR